ncbi:MAG: ATP synthase F1 subunit delta [Calditrichaeota bacterium]|nr:ATP synthase F1 subunit delta [Calditrichota bacterium]MCB9391606.1 ATP synthase F1 subunit delta [Calditrichota bacterium]
MKGFHGPLPTRYARSLFAAAQKVKCVAEVERDLQALDTVFRENRELPLLLGNPSLGNVKRRAILKSIGAKLGFCEMTDRFIELLIEKSRLDLLETIPARYHEFWRQFEGEVEVTVQTAVPVSESMKEQIKQSIAQRSGKKPVITYQVVPALLGGVVVIYPDHQLDGSLARKVQELGKRLASSV